MHIGNSQIIIWPYNTCDIIFGIENDFTKSEGDLLVVF